MRTTPVNVPCGRNSSMRGCRYVLTALAGWLLISTFCIALARATPPDYATFDREQKVEYNPDPDDVMRIWMVYVGQGDGLLIQLPLRCNYDMDPEDDDPERAERVDVLIDGGSHLNSNAGRMADFLIELYDEPAIEHAVITHHDSDHVKGLIHILEDDSVTVESIYHNGLASYAPGKRGFSDDTRGTVAVIDRSSGQLKRGMAFLEDDRVRMKGEYLINNLTDLQQRLADEEFQGVYESLARAVVDEAAPFAVTAFRRCYEGGTFIGEREEQLDRGVDLTDISFELIWPLNPPRKYGDWGETINGNSVTFRLKYGNFEMLFTGDHNEKSEKALLEHLAQAGQLDLLSCDVLKAPHHASDHAYEDFFGPGGVDPVVSIASMGHQGFKSKTMSSGAWQHPSTDVISWLGGSHRVYHTLIHERKFRWSDLRTTADHERMHEYSHILVETDGEWFRIVEVDIDTTDPNSPPSVNNTRRGNGTRWIEAD